MLGTLAFETVRQKHDETAQPPPFVLAAGDELIDDDLRGVDEIAELRLPYDQAVGPVEAVAPLEAQHAGLGQRTVVNFEFGLARRQVLQRHVGFAALRVTEHRVPVAEGAALAILPGDAHFDPVGQDRGESQCFRRGPIESALPLDMASRLLRIFSMRRSA